MKELKVIEDKVIRFLGKSYWTFRLGMVAIIGFIINECPMVAYAAGTTIKSDGDGDAVANEITAPMKTLIRVILTVMSVVGVFMLVKSILELVNAIQQQDNTGLFHAGRGIAVALLMIAIFPVVSLFVEI